MRTVIKASCLAICVIGLWAGCAKKHSAEWKSIQNPDVTAQLKSFVAEKESQADAAGGPTPPEFKDFFAAAQRGDWLEVSNIFETFSKHAPQYQHSGKTDARLHGTQWEAVKEVWGGLFYFGAGDEKYSTAYANDIIKSIPPGSIYFGGTDPGRFLISAMQKSQVDGEPFFTLTQNALADRTYLDYLRSMYGDKIYIPTAEDSQKCFQDYMEDAQKRAKENKLKPGEDVSVDPNGRVRVSGQVAVMQINALLTKIIFDQNSNREFYVEESFPLDWMYPCLEPNGLIMKINRRPLAGLSAEMVQRDHDYWTGVVSPMIGDWLNDDTSLQTIAAYIEKVYVKKDLSGFAGDTRFINSAESQKMFSKERSSIAGLYAWRAEQASSSSERKRMDDAADFAFRQSWALCPYSPEAVVRYVNLLMADGRVSDALMVAETAAKLPELKGKDGVQIRAMMLQLQDLQRSGRGR